MKENGVWRTVGGRRIFIRDGENLSSAMKRSGKFKIANKKDDKKNTNKMTDEERKKKIEELEKKKDETIGFLQKGAIQEEINMLKDNFQGTKEEYREYLAKEQERRLKEYEKEKEQRQKERESQNNNEDYKMAHRPTETGITADDLLKEGNEGIGAPKDIYEHPEYYSIGEKKYLTETMRQLNEAKGNPNAEITIYRATIGDKINDGDWITLSKNYAEMHNESQLDGKGKVLEMKVKAKDIQFAGDALEEWGYFPKNSSLSKDFSNMSRQQLATLLVENQIERGIIKPESKQRQIQARLNGQFKMSKDDLVEYAKKYLK